jgi:hypothetical protein
MLLQMYPNTKIYAMGIFFSALRLSNDEAIVLVP